MKRIPGMPLESQVAYRRSLILAALSGLCARPSAHDRVLNTGSIAEAAITTADVVIDRLGKEQEPIALRPGFNRRITYVVQPGDTLSEIARKTGTHDPKDPSASGYFAGAMKIAKVNRIADPGHIEPGWELIIPPIFGG